MNFLIVEDDKFFRHKLKSELEAYGNTLEAHSKEQALGHLATRKFDLCFIDLNLDEDKEKFEGFDIVKYAHEKGLKTIVLTGHTGQYTKVESYKRGCFGYIIKKKFLTSPKEYIAPIVAQLDHAQINNFFEKEYITAHLPLIESIIKLKEVVCTGKHSILLTGETGVGKTSIAKLINRLSGQPAQNFIHLNLGQVPKNLIESELFGTVKGAFTGAVDKVGILEKANGGTLFLDEIDALPKSSQVKIQVALEEGSFMRVGGNKSIKSSFQLISATCNDLVGLIKSNNLREDFFYRIRGYEVHIPPLRERKEDIQLILNHLIKDLAMEMVFTEDALKEIRQFSWPGNIRQLKDFVHSFQALSQYYIDKDLAKKTLNTMIVNTSTQKILSAKLKKIIHQHGLQYLIDQIERQALKDALAQEGNLTRASEALRIGNRRAKRVFDQLTTGEGEGLE